MRKFITCLRQGGLADVFRDRYVDRLIGHLVLWIQTRALGKRVDQQLRQYVDIRPRRRGDRHDVREVDSDLTAQLLRVHQLFSDSIRGHCIGFRHDSDADGLGCGHLLSDVSIARTDVVGGRQTQSDDVDVRERLVHLVVQTLTQQRAGAMHSRSVDDDQLAVASTDDAANCAARGLWSIGRDRHLGPHDRVH